LTLVSCRPRSSRNCIIAPIFSFRMEKRSRKAFTFCRSISTLAALKYRENNWTWVNVLWMSRSGYCSSL